MSSTSEPGSGPVPPDGLALRLEQAAAAARQAAVEPGGSGRLLEALAEMGDCLVQAEAVVRGAGAGPVSRLRPALERLESELRQLDVLIGGGLELASRLGGAAGYGSARPEPGGRAVRVDETG